MQNNRHQPTLRLSSIVLGFVLVLLSACGSGTTSSTTTNVNVQLSWLHNIEFAGFYMAQNKGFYSEANLHVELHPSGYDDQGNFIDPIALVTSGKADFGVTDGTTLLSARDSGTPIVAIATIYQRHPLAFTSLAEKNIVHPQDLVGKTVAVSDVSKTIYTALLSAQGIDPTTINYVERTDFTEKPLLDNQVDVIDAWLTNEVVQLTEEGHAVNNIIPSEYGIEAYPDVIFTTEDMIAKNPGLVEQFLKATVRGLQSAVDDPDNAAKLSVTYDPKTLNEQTEIDAMQQSLPLINPVGSKPGMMTDNTWDYMNKIMTEQGLLAKPLDLKAAYNLTFLQKIYNGAA